jgi:D-cysteine desulfhydrase/L-cysteate sulfo-lyase
MCDDPQEGLVPTPLTADQLRQAAATLPRVALAHLPTPLEEAARFAARLNGPRVFVKRDDCTGMALGGNKTRHNEFLLAAALRQGADCLVWGAGVQSNNCRQTAAACNRLGLECYLYLSRAAHNDDVQGNLLLDHLLGAHITIIDTPLGPALDELLHAKAQELRAVGRRPFVWDRGSNRPVAAVSYALALAELLDQATALAQPSVIKNGKLPKAPSQRLVFRRDCAVQWPRGGGHRRVVRARQAGSGR